MMFRMGSKAELTQKYERVKVQNDISRSKHINKQISQIFNRITPRESLARFAHSPTSVCLSTNGERALNYTIVKRLILTTNIQTTKIKSSC